MSEREQFEQILNENPWVCDYLLEIWHRQAEQHGLIRPEHPTNA